MVVPTPWTYVSAVPSSAATIMKQLDLRGSPSQRSNGTESTSNHAPGVSDHSPEYSDRCPVAADDEIVLTSIMDSRQMSVEVHAAPLRPASPTPSEQTPPIDTPATQSVSIEIADSSRQATPLAARHRHNHKPVSAPLASPDLSVISSSDSDACITGSTARPSSLLLGSSLDLG